MSIAWLHLTPTVFTLLTQSLSSTKPRIKGNLRELNQNKEMKTRKESNLETH